jgi:hypothetical protein
MRRRSRLQYALLKPSGEKATTTMIFLARFLSLRILRQERKKAEYLSRQSKKRARGKTLFRGTSPAGSIRKKFFLPVTLGIVSHAKFSFGKSSLTQRSGLGLSWKPSSLYGEVGNRVIGALSSPKNRSNFVETVSPFVGGFRAPSFVLD